MKKLLALLFLITPAYVNGASQPRAKKTPTAAAPAQVSKKCSVCPKEETTMAVCGQCKNKYYCSAKCQKEDWPVHKKTCTKKIDVSLACAPTSPAIHAEETKAASEIKATSELNDHNVRMYLKAALEKRTDNNTNCLHSSIFVIRALTAATDIERDFFMAVLGNRTIGTLMPIPQFYKQHIPGIYATPQVQDFFSDSAIDQHSIGLIIFDPSIDKSFHAMTVEKLTQKGKSYFRIHQSWIDSYALDAWEGLAPWNPTLDPEIATTEFSKYGKGQFVSLEAMEKYLQTILRSLAQYKAEQKIFTLDTSSIYFRKFDIDHARLQIVP